MSDPRAALLALAMLDEPYDADPTLSRKLAQLLGLPSDAPPVQIATLDVVDRHALTTPIHWLGPGDFNYALPTKPLRHLHGYYVELFGTLVPADWAEGRVWELDLGRGIGVRAVRLWRVRVRYGESQLYAQSRWPPGQAEHLSIHGFEHSGDPEDGRHARRGLTKLQQLPAQWRPPGRPSVAERPERSVPFLRDIARLKREHPDWKAGQLAAEAGVPGPNRAAKAAKVRRWHRDLRRRGSIPPA
jgi:hypothetical protein